jgi:hypothetical protein
VLLNINTAQMPLKENRRYKWDMRLDWHSATQKELLMSMMATEVKVTQSE